MSGIFPRTAAAGLYDLRPHTAVFRELSAYEAAFTQIENRLSELETLYFPENASRAALEQTAALYGLTAPPDMTIDQLRAGVRALAQGSGHSLSSIKDWFLTLGAAVTLTEQPDKKRVLMRGTYSGLCTGSDTLERLLQAVLPTGISAALDIGALTWILFESKDLTVQALDAVDKTWDRIDLL